MGDRAWDKWEEYLDAMRDPERRKVRTIPETLDDERGGWRVRGRWEKNERTEAHWFPRLPVAPGRLGEKLSPVSACGRMKLSDADARLYHTARCGQCDIARARWSESEKEER